MLLASPGFSLGSVLHTASITYGYASSDGNGYRAVLYNLLANDGNVVNMVGSQKGGNFQDPDNEGYPGLVISQVNDHEQTDMPTYRPNIATILVGTNDALQNIDPAGAPDRLHKLIDDVLNWPWLTMVVVATLPPNANANANALIDQYNAAIPGVRKGIHGPRPLGDYGRHPFDGRCDGPC